MVALTRSTRLLVKALFPPDEVLAAENLLVEKCGDNLPFCESSSAAGMERIRFAALKISRGDYSQLDGAVNLANTDWRDLLVAAAFANDTKVHEAWCENFLLEKIGV
jgi:hypothetical protein